MSSAEPIESNTLKLYKQIKQSLDEHQILMLQKGSGIPNDAIDGQSDAK
jgi:hypothetical protein